MTGRREFLKVGAAAAGGLLLSLSVPLPMRPARASDSTDAIFAPNAFIRIDRQGTVTLVMPMVEMGQGTYTSLPMLLAEELEVPLDQVRLEHAPANDSLYANAILHVQSTGLSSSIRAFWNPMRQAGAVGRTLMIAAAAKRWQIEPGRCYARSGRVFESGTDRSSGYGQLVELAATLPVPAAGQVPLKDPGHFTLIGSPAHRLDTQAKTNGTAKFGIDFRVPGMRVATLAQSPTFGGKVRSVNETAALAVKGVHQVVRLDNVVAVVADHMAAAKKGLAAAAIEWDNGPNANVTTADVIRQLEEASKQPGVVARNDGDAQSALATAHQRLDAIYHAPFLAHATMEPMNCTVHVRKDGCDIWVGTQAPTLTQDLIARLTGLPRESVQIHNHLIGGGFGRRLEADGSVVATRIAQHVEGPVKVVWTREEDIQHDMYRPYYFDRLSAALDAKGNPVAWTHRVAGPSIIARYLPPLFKNGLDFDAIEGAAQPPYAFPNIHVDYVRVEPSGIPTAFWRGVGATHNVFVVETFMDTLAHAAKRDPVEFRKSLLAHNPRALGVLLLAAEKSGWGEPLPKGHGRGISLQFAFGSYLAQVAEVEVNAKNTLRVRRLVTAVDCGMVVNPDTVAAQMEGGSLFGLTAALFGSITLRGGRVEQSNFHDYRPLRINEAPIVETHIVPSGEAPGGIGEAGTAIVAPAVANAIFAANGRQIRTLPFGMVNSGT
ncbi:MAG: xanthine dehydrogenase family protein molybdopterin-binding subunit [Proteobacteria bacterium]|nr:xanthine dehydrogenase family protein molybdopterin-binding subunit [Pseudomonadota bacterium]